MELEDWEGNKTFAQYDYFKVGGYEDKYRLAVAGYSGTAGLLTIVEFRSRTQISSVIVSHIKVREKQ